ncbi:MAG: NUDIX hydrolase [Hyphomicrobiales bacterium]|uniref:NUDIX hydrolase n=1 Tax=Rhabdaerophilum calidifontis TaxID=2604328 RepID=UPI00123B9DC4|nr:NUDIX hydrolase [Rhabdaerophilum calidifontis]MCA1952975.1 NUDIX hydrolase [Hyphomicrobiales bacterium]MCA1999599.1 NUDIX hydrolase [Hyphomicrobiales bacterium]
MPEQSRPAQSSPEAVGVAPEIAELDGLDCRLEPAAWAFAREQEAAIAAHWARFVADKPTNFNGRVFLQHRWDFDGRIYRGRYLETDYASFIAWRDFGHPGAPMRNGFAMAALRARDGAFLLGVMGPGTANPGRIYFAAGTPDPGDLLPDGRIDLAGSVLRELEEETGLRPEEVHVGAGWRAVIDGTRAAFMRPVTIDLPAAEARRLILDRFAGLAHEELVDIHIVRGPEDFVPGRMPPFQIAYLADAFARGG